MNFLQNIINNIETGNGTANYYHRLNKNSIYTDGIKDFLDKTEAQWLYDIIESEIYLLLKSQPQYDVYKLHIESTNREVDLKVEDYQYSELWNKCIPSATLPEGSATVYVGYDGERLITSLISEN